MEHLLHPLFNPYLQDIIKTFQTTAGQSLRGPSRYSSTCNGDQILPKTKMSEEDYEEYKRALGSVLKREPVDPKIMTDPFLLPPPFPVQQVPIFLPMDTCTEGISRTKLDGEEISCFDIGGEKRLCLPQILNTLLRQFSMNEVQEASRELNLNFSRCTPEQLSMLKCSNVLPASAQSCGLITKTDAARLSNKLILGGETVTHRDTYSSRSFKVYHECFGKCKGLLDPDLYKSEDSPCIECCECHRLFQPQKFVCHSHAAQENRICHWGFDNANWRSYLLLAKDQEPLQNIIKCLEEIKDRFNKNQRKRKQVVDGEQEGKRIRGNVVALTAYSSWPKERLPADLKQSPPVVLNPEKIVPFSGHDRYDRDFVPNVSLAPSNALNKLKKDLSRDSRPPLPSISSEGPDAICEIDVSSTDSDSEDGSAPQSPPRRFECRDMKGVQEELRRNREKELALVQQALDGKVGGDQASKEAFLQEYLQSRAAEQKLVHDLSEARDDLQAEIEKQWAKKEEVSWDMRQAERAAERARAEWDSRKQEAVNERNELRREREELHRNVRSVDEIKEKYEKQMEQLHNQYQQAYGKMGQEIRLLREELRKAGRDVPTLHSPPANGSSLLKAALHSPKEKAGGDAVPTT